MKKFLISAAIVLSGPASIQAQAGGLLGGDDWLLPDFIRIVEIDKPDFGINGKKGCVVTLEQKDLRDAPLEARKAMCRIVGC